MAKVSIIVPVYNTEKYLKKCLDSLIEQTLLDIEIIIINDGSVDESHKIITKYKDRRIKYIKKENEGIGKTRNLGIDSSSGEYLMFIDSDDYIARDCVEKMYNRAVSSGADIVISNYYENRDGSIKEIKFKSFEDASLKENPRIINNINLGPCNKLYHKSIFASKGVRFEENLKYEDVPFVCMALLKAKKISKIEECLSYYVIHSNSETTVRDKKIFDILEISKIIFKEMKKYDYMQDALIDLLVMILTDYTIQQRYIKVKCDRDRFIDGAFSILDDLGSDWRKTDYLYKFSFLKRIVKRSSFLTKLYCDMYNIRGEV